MRFFILATAIFAMVACESGPAFTDVQAADTIEAYEAFLANDPTTFYKPEIDKRLEELYFEKAKTEKTIAAWDTYFAKFPDGKNKKDALEAKAGVAFAEAEKVGTTEAYEKFLADNPGTGAAQERAAGLLAVARYGKIVVSEPVAEQVNLAEDPNGPKNGWGVRATVSNTGDKTFKYVDMTVELLADDGALLERKDYPLVSPTWPLTATEEQTRPFAPGDSRTWVWTAALDGVPAGWNQKVEVYANDLRE